MSPAQVKFLNENAPAYFAWLKATGESIGIKVQPWQRRIIEAVTRKDFMTADGHITDTGQTAWNRAVDTAVRVAKRNGTKVHPRVAELKGKTATLVVIDDPD
jgi:hypothetical protein